MVFIVKPLRQILMKAHEPLRDLDFLCCVNHRLFTYLLICIGLSVLAREYSGHPMHCWTKPEWAMPWIKYTSNLCYIEGTYYIPLNESLPTTYELDMDHKKLNNYQWAPYLFTAFGVIMLFPRSFWDLVNQSSTLQMSQILIIGRKSKRAGLPKYTTVKNCAGHLKYALEQNRKITGVNIFSDIWVKLFGSRFHTYVFFFIKLWNMVNVVIILILLVFTIAEENFKYLGVDTIVAIMKGMTWRESGLFPIVTVCAFNVRELGESIFDSVQRNYVVQCVLQTNFIFAKSYVFLWCALVALQVCNLYSIIAWTAAFFPWQRKTFITNLTTNALDFMLLPADQDKEYKRRDTARYLVNISKMEERIEQSKKQNVDQKILEKLQESLDALSNEYNVMKKEREEKRAGRRALYTANKDDLMDEFIEFLGADGFFALRMLDANYGSFVASHLASKMLWKFIKNKCQ